MNRPASNKLRPAAATLGVCAALGLAAVPMARVWLTPEESPQPIVNPFVSDGTDRVVVDLRDDATDSDVQRVRQATGLNLQFASPFAASSDKVMEASLTPGQTEQGVLDTLRRDPAVEVAEPEVMYSLPNNPYAEPQQAWEVSRVVAIHEAGRYNAMHDGTALGDGALLRALGDSPEFVAAPLIRPVDETSGSENGDARTAEDFKPNDPRYGEQWNFQMVGAEKAWKKSRGKGVIVAVIDTGVAAGPVKKGKPCRDFNTTRFVPGYDFVNKNNDAFDDHGHGTHVAGTIAESTNNNEGVAGLAFDATIMPLKVLSAQGYGTSAAIADAIRWAADHGANVINMSLGSSSPSDVIHSACKYAYKKGVTIVCAAGNSFKEGVGYPAAYPECIAVSSVGPTGNLAFYSSYGKQVALAAPGGDMSNGAEGGILQNTILKDGGDEYYRFQGTSMASPHVAAVAALIEAQGVTDPAKVREVLTASATPKGEKIKYGAGILSAEKATEKAAQQTGPNALQGIVAVMAGLMLTVGMRRRRQSPLLRGMMAVSLLAAFFGPDWFAARVGADSAWNLLTFSALLPLALFAATRRSGALVKVAGAAALGLVLSMTHDLFVDAAPFTTATFGATTLPWIYTNLAAAFTIIAAVTTRAWRATRPQR